MEKPQVFSIVFLGLTVLFAATLHADTSDKAMAGRHRIEMGFGLLSDIESENYTVPGATDTKVSIDGPAFSLGYAYWPAEQWSLSVRFVVLGVDARQNISAGGISTEASTVVPFLFAVGFHPSALAPSPGVRPFFTAGVGSFTGVRAQDRAGIGGVIFESRTESTIGAHFGAGLDCLLSRLFSLRFSGGYYLASDFDQPISGQKNYSTPEFTVALGFNFGRGR